MSPPERVRLEEGSSSPLLNWSLFTLRPQELDFESFCRLFPDHFTGSDETLVAVQKGLITTNCGGYVLCVD